MKGSSLALGIAVSVACAATIAACDDSPGRNPLLPTPPTPAPRPFYVLSGTITEPVGVPLPGAAVTITDGVNKDKSTTTDAGGRYTLAPVEGGFSVAIKKDGYATAARGVDGPNDVELNVELIPLVPPANVSGSWNVTVRPHSTCPALTNNDVRRYRATIVQRGAPLEISLSGGTLIRPPALAGLIHGTEVWVELPGGECAAFYCYYYYDDSEQFEVVESLPNNQFLAIAGVITATARGSSVSGSLNGEFAVIQSTESPSDVLASCAHEGHPVTFTR